MEAQKTIAKSVSLCGVGLHTGESVELVLHPASPDTGIVFKRVDMERSEPLKVSLGDCRADAMRGSILIRDGVRILTVEHLLAAVKGLGVDNLWVEIKGVEVPAMDGSALPFAEKILEAGLVEQDAPKRFVHIERPLWIRSGDSLIAVFPYRGFKVSYTIAYDHPLLKAQYMSYELSPESFLREIAPARTYVFKHELDRILGSGLGKGGSLENTVIIGESGVLNPGGLRFEDEFVRHKVLDLIGDMALLGLCLRGHVVAIKAGHALHLALASKIVEEVKGKGAEDRYHYEGLTSSLSLSACG